MKQLMIKLNISVSLFSATERYDIIDRYYIQCSQNKPLKYIYYMGYKYYMNTT